MTTRPLVLLALFAAACSRATDSDTKSPILMDDTGGSDSADTGETGDSADSGDPIDTGKHGETDTDSGVIPIDNDGDGSDSTLDCDDNNATIYPGAPELCDGLDNDCDGHSDAEEDADADGISDCTDYCPVYSLPGASGDGRVIDPVGTMQEAVDLAGSSGCNEVRAYKGTYYENIDWHGYPVNAESVSGSATTVLDGGDAAAVLSFQSAEPAEARVYDFTITHGGGGKGGGIYIYLANPTIEGNLLTANNVEVVSTSELGTGAGIWSYNASPTIIDNIITGNDACYGGPENGCDGGAIAVRGGEPLIARNELTDNSAGDGGAIWLAYSDATVVNNLIAGNAASDTDPEAGGQGGGINVQIGGTAGPWITANIIADNSAGMFGGGIVTYEDNSAYADATIVNNTIVYNEVIDTDYGAGICQFRRTTPTFMNNIIAYNYGVGAYSEDGIDSTFTYNVVYGNETDYGGLLTGSGAGNVDGDPRFASATENGDWTDDDYTLGSGSSAHDAGNPAAAYYDVDGSRNDVGAFGGPEGSGW